MYANDVGGSAGGNARIHSFSLRDRLMNAAYSLYVFHVSLPLSLSFSIVHRPLSVFFPSDLNILTGERGGEE